MTLEYWVHFEEGEKKKLVEIMTNNSNPILANMAIQETFNISMTEADSVIDMYNKRIKK